jgi:hypothetical protein
MGMVAAAVVLVPVGWKVLDDALDLDGCDGPTDWHVGLEEGPGSCALPFGAADIADGDVGFELRAEVGEEGGVWTSYHVTNHTSEWRSVDSSKVKVVDSRGRTIDCNSDDSAVMVASESESTQTHACGGAPDGHGGVYELVYDNMTVDSVDLRR